MTNLWNGTGVAQFTRAFLMAGSLFWAYPAEAAERWEIMDPWVREAPPGSRVLAAYGTVRRPVDRSGALVEVLATGFKRAETHAMVKEGSWMRMRGVPRLTVPAGGEVRLEPGEWHWMLYEPSRDLREGDRVQVEFVFDDGVRLRKVLPVRRYQAP